MQCITLQQVLEKRKSSENTGITFIAKSNSEHFLSYRELYERALRGLYFLQSQGVRPGSELVFQTDDNETFIISFWACMLGGIIPVPLSVGQSEEHKRKVLRVWQVLHNPYLLAAEDKLDRLRTLAGQEGMNHVFLRIKDKHIEEAGLANAEGKGQVHEVKENDIAFIQFSSGSTGYPKGVVLTHRNLLTNVKAISEAAAYTAHDSMLSWMPLTHDMGLIGFHLNPLWSGMHQYLMPTQLFIRRPGLWLDKASEHGVTILCSPNFGYKYLLKHCPADGAYHWDLSRVRLLYNGAEPISEELCRHFSGRLAGYGLHAHAMCPVYGLAEASLAVSVSGPGTPVGVLHLDRGRLSPGNKILPAAPGPGTVSFVGVGRPVRNCAIRIAGDHDRPVAAETVGRLQIRGDNVTRGYYNDEEATRSVLRQNNWLDTGDLGFVQEGILYITGRTKDIIFINGQNYYPHDIERVAEAVDGIELNKIAVASFFNDRNGQEEAVAFVFHRGSLADFVPLAQAVKAVVNRETGLSLERVIPVKDIPRTTSGKLQRFSLLEQLRNGRFAQLESELARLMPDPAAVPPENEAERRLLGVWQHVLGNDQIGVTHGFFEAGGNSLSAAEHTMHVLAEFGVELPLEVLYEKQTVRQLVREIATLPRQAYRPIPAAAPDAYYPASPAQRRLYYAWETDKASVAYNLPVAFRVQGDVDVNRLEHCIRQLIRRHDSLRMIFRLGADPEFSISGPTGFALRCTPCHPGRRNAQLRELVQPFDLAAGSLFRAELLTSGPDENLLFLDFHHIIADGISVHHFMAELAGLCAGKSLPPLPAGYRDYACWEKARRQSPKVKAQGAYWRDLLGGELPVLQLPTDFNRPPAFHTEGEKLAFSLSGETTRGLRQLARQNQCTLHTVLLAVYRVLLWKYTAQEDAVVGIPVANRPHADLQRVQGMFVNNLALRGTVDAQASFNRFLQTEKRRLVGALSNQEYPFEELLGDTGRKRDVSRNPLFDTMFVYQHLEKAEFGNSGLTFSRHFFDPGFAKFDLTLEVLEEAGEVHYAVEYATRLFRRDTITRFAGHYRQLIAAVLEDSGRALWELSVLPAREYDACIRQFNASATPYPREKTVHRLFEERVRQSPGAIAVEYGGHLLTYQQLDDQARGLARRLSAKGVGPNDVVAVLLPRSPGLIISLLGILKAGGAFLPVDADLPAERIGYILSDSRCKVLITGPAHLAALPPTAGTPQIACLYEEGPGEELPGPAPSAAAARPGDLAYVMYTSGTTGRPKGVMIEHRSLVNYTWWAAQQYIKGEAVAFPLYTSISFDLTITSIFTPLLTGNSIVIYGEERESSLLEQVVGDNKVDVIKLTPSHLRVLREITLPPGGSRIKRFIVGGEELETRLAREIHHRFGPETEIYNEYGPTEATVGCMIHRFAPGDDAPGVPIGVPAANTQVYLLDRFLKPVPAGVYGEVYLSGDGIARGYLFRDELTAQRFLPNPFAGGQRMYKTGDLARQLPHGVMAYAGRIDEQVKLNGYRIEPAEIAQQLMTHEGITGALVTIRSPENQPMHLCAYYTTQASPTDPPAEPVLRHYLAARLPHYMIPVHFVRLAQIPLTRNGKVDYAALPDPASDPAPAENASPAGETETTSLRVWAEILGRNNLRVTDNFFEMGGDSIKAVQIVSRLRGLGIDLQPKHILTYQSVRQTSLHAATARPPIYEQGTVSGKKGLTPIEAWFFGWNFRNPGFYNQSVLLRLKEKADVRLLAKAFRTLIEHHDGLRINYDPGKGELFYNNAHLATDFTVEQLIMEPVAGGEAPTQTAGRSPGGPGPYAALKSGFDLTKSLLIRAAVGKAPGSAEWLFITVHHLCTDGLSWRILLEDLRTTYRALAQGEAVRLPAKTATLVDWERKWNEYAASGAVSREADYWEATEKVPFALRLDVETDDWQVSNLAQQSGGLDPDKTRFLLTQAHAAYTTDVPILLNTALALALREWTGLHQFVVEQENHGRHLEGIDASQTVGWFTALYPVVLELPGDAAGPAIKAVKEQLRRVPNHGLGYGLRHYGRRNGSRLAEVRFNYLGQFGPELDNELFSYTRQSTGWEADPGNTMTARLELNAMVTGGALHLAVNYNRKAHAAATIRRFTDSFFLHLGGILEHVKNEQNVHFTPSDFNAVELNQEELDALF